MQNFELSELWLSAPLNIYYTINPFLYFLEYQMMVGRYVSLLVIPKVVTCYNNISPVEKNACSASCYSSSFLFEFNYFFLLPRLKFHAESDDGGKFLVYNRWGRVGIKGQDKIHGPYPSRESAIQEFEQKFFAKTKNAWSDRNNFVSHPKSYVWLEMDYSGKEKESTVSCANSVSIVIFPLVM